MTKLRGFVQQITNPVQYALGNLVRFWIQSQYHVATGDRWGQITFSPTWQKFPHPFDEIQAGDLDGYFRYAKDKGIQIIGCIANGYNKQYPVALKTLPKDNPNLDKILPESYSIYTKLVEQFVLRYGSVIDDSKIDIADYGNHPSNPQPKVSGLNLVTYTQLLNEVNGYSGADPAQVLTGSQYALLFDYWCEKIWAIDPNMRIISAPTAKLDIVWLDDFTGNSRYIGDSRCDISANIYLFGGCGVWGTCDAIKPENSTLFEQFNSWLVSKNLYGYVTEFGCNSVKYSDLGYPEYPGKDGEESQAEFLLRSFEKWLAQSNIKGATGYKQADDSETRFAKTGTRYAHGTNPPPKKSYDIIKTAWEQEPTTKPITITLKETSSITIQQ